MKRLPTCVLAFALIAPWMAATAQRVAVSTVSQIRDLAERQFAAAEIDQAYFSDPKLAAVANSCPHDVNPQMVEAQRVKLERLRPDDYPRFKAGAVQVKDPKILYCYYTLALGQGS